jgi:hypothetical protein
VKRHVLIFPLLGALAAPALAEEPTRPNSAESSVLERASRSFWEGVEALNLIFTSIGVLSGGADRGEIWTFDLRSGQRSRIGTGGDLAWPVLAPDGTTVYALRGNQLVRFDDSGSGTVAAIVETGWRKLLGVRQDGAVIGFVKGVPRARPAILLPTGELQTFQHAESDEEEDRTSTLLEENRAYADGRNLMVKRSARGGRGFDVFLVSGGKERNLSDCGDDACGQPSLSPDGQRVLYVRDVQH